MYWNSDDDRFAEIVEYIGSYEVLEVAFDWIEHVSKYIYIRLTRANIRRTITLKIRRNQENSFRPMDGQFMSNNVIMIRWEPCGG